VSEGNLWQEPPGVRKGEGAWLFRMRENEHTIARAAGQLAQGAASRSLRPLGAYRIPYADRREEG